MLVNKCQLSGGIVETYDESGFIEQEKKDSADIEVTILLKCQFLQQFPRVHDFHPSMMVSSLIRYDQMDI